jgi:hypothetical protein
VEWDAARREDGRWTLTGDYQTPERSGTARFAYDAPGNFVMAENDDATWLIGEFEDAPPATDDLSTVRQRRLNSVPDEQQLALTGVSEAPEPDALGEDALDLVAETQDAVSTEDLTETAARIREAAVDDPDLGPRPSADDFLDRVFAAQNPEPPRPAPAVDSAEREPESEAGEAALRAEELSEGEVESTRDLPHRREVKKNRGRASVPSWDEIMFGSGNPD